MNVKGNLLKILSQAEEEYTSGAAIAERLGVSRNAVWKAVRALEAEGHTLESSKAKGYRLAYGSVRLNEHLISDRLTTVQLGRSLTVLDEVGSTNDYAKKLFTEGAVHGTVIVADHQRSGKGRMGRSFISPPEKGLYMSVLIRPDYGLDIAPLITTAAACAVADAVEELCALAWEYGSTRQPAETENSQDYRDSVGIKWVNDLYMSGRKICGILTEASLNLELQALDYAIIGIGVNVLDSRSELGEELSSVAVSIEEITGLRLNRSVLCAQILNRLEERLANLETRQFLEDYRRREMLTGNVITAHVGAEEIIGTAVGVDDSANLIVRTEDGSERHLSSGEASLCRIKT